MVLQTPGISDLLLARGRDDDIAIIDGAGRYTYRDLRHAVAIQTERIHSWDLPAGSRIGLVGHNSFLWAAGYLAVMHAGHTAVPFAPVLNPGDVLAKAAHVGCDSLLIDERMSRRFAAVVDGLSRTSIYGHTETTTTADAVRQLPEARPAAANAVLVFTSGTTSRPRAVCVSHRNIQANTASIVQYLGLCADDRMLVVLPFSYCFGASLLHTHLFVGGSVRICETQAFPETIVDAIDAERCTGFAGVPSSYQMLLRASSFESRRLPSLRHLQQAGGRLPHPQIARIAAAQPHARLFVMYGQTEATARLAYLPPELIDTKPGSVGHAIPGVQLRITDEDGVDLRPGAVGEIRARGANVTQGYWADPEGTAAKFVDGELRTGDLGRTDEDGFLYVVDRRDDFIKSWGYRISSQEIQDAALELPGVMAAAAVGRPDPDAGEAIVLFVSLRADGDTTVDDIRGHLRTRLAKHLVPQEIRAIDQLPLNENGKVVKTELRKLVGSVEPVPQHQP